MKNFTQLQIIVIIFSLSFYSTKAQTEYQLDSIQQFQYDESFMSLQMKQRTHYSYDIGGVKYTGSIDSTKVSGIWTPNLKLGITYNSDNNVKTEIYQTWDDINQWLKLYRTDYEYDEFKNNTLLTYFNSLDGITWIETGKTTSAYNEANQIKSQINEFTDPLYMILSKDRILYTYEDGNNTLIEYEYWNSTSGKWEMNQKTVNTYDGNLIMQQDNFIWAGGPDWPETPQSRQLYNYISSDIYDITYQSDTGSGLTNRTKIFYTFNGIWPLEIEYKLWENNDWLEESKTIVDYDGNNNYSKVSIYINWDSNLNSYALLNTEYRYFWSEAQPLGVSLKNLTIAKAYPNPFKNDLNITLPTFLDYEAKLQVFDVHGKEVSSTKLKPGSKLIKLENSNLANGLYIIKVSSKSQNEIFKVIKE